MARSHISSAKVLAIAKNPNPPRESDWVSRQGSAIAPAPAATANRPLNRAGFASRGARRKIARAVSMHMLMKIDAKSGASPVKGGIVSRA